LNAAVGSVLRVLLPLPVRRFTRTVALRCSQWPLKGTVRFGSLRRLTPIDADWGFSRGLPIDRYYLENFLRDHADDIRGRVLEVDNNAYTRKFGGSKVTRSDVLHIGEQGPGVTLVGDLQHGDHLPSDAFDCIVLTQVLNLAFDARAAIRTVHRMLGPGGVALVTVPGLTRMLSDAEHQWGHCWGFTTFSLGRIFREEFPGGTIEVASCGNVLSTTAFFYGLATDELRPHELDHHDPEIELLVTLRAVKAPAPRREDPS
jgi:SAM-dependent methyltransferase